MSGERMGAFPALKPGTGGKAPSVVKAVSGPHGEQPDMMRQGFSSVRANLVPKHPVESIQESEEMNLAIAATVTGRGLPAHIQAERTELAKIRRLPVLHSSMCALEISLGLESTIEFDDYLNDPRQPEAIGSVHAMCEASPYFR